MAERPPLMTPWSARSLTAGERTLCDDTFGSTLRLDAVRVWSCPPIGWTTKRAFVPGGLLWPGRSLVVYPPAQARCDFSDAPLHEQGVFVHEMTHVWQSQNGVNLLMAKLRAGDSAAAYSYRLGPDCLWDGLNIEQQAMIVQHDFLRRRGAFSDWPEEAFLAVLPFSRGPGHSARA